MPADVPFDCLCLGIVVADHVCEPISHLPRAGELVLTPRTHLSIGGCAANVAVDLVRLGRKAAVVGRVGDDPFGRFLIDALDRAHVDVGHIACVPGEATSTSMIINVRDDDRRFIHTPGANARLEGDEISPELLAQTRAVYVGGFGLSDKPAPDKIAALFRAAREIGVKTLLDVVVPEGGNCWPLLEPVLPYTDVFLPNEDEARALTKCAEAADQARAFRDAGAETVVITRGHKGVVVASTSGVFRANSFPIEFVDGTGGGDAFAAGYVHALLSGGNVNECVRVGSALGASCVRVTGATTGVFDAAELAEFLNSRSLDVFPV
ncbi:MAG TPA: carbohydrate kinase family protein [Planctomycetaceae bacterium]|nr:carbohydrate kinase family protein [Planctomycetaceae bacterium]